MLHRNLKFEVLILLITVPLNKFVHIFTVLSLKIKIYDYFEHDWNAIITNNIFFSIADLGGKINIII